MTSPQAAAQWTPVAHGVFSPAAVATGERRLLLVVRGPAGELMCRQREGAAWSELRTLAPSIARADSSGATIPVEWPVNACGTADGRVHLLARGPEGELVHGVLNGEEWSGFELVGTPTIESGSVSVPMGLTSAPVACSRERGHMDVFAVGGTGDLVHAEFDGTDFSEFVSLGRVARRAEIPDMPVPGPISATHCGERRMAVVTRGVAGDAMVKWWDGSAWNAFESIGWPEEDNLYYPGNPRPVPLSGPLVACGGGSARLDVFARGGGGDLMHRSWDGAQWSPFESLGMPLSEAGAPVPFTATSVACVWGRFRLDVFALAADGKLYDLSWNGAPLARSAG